MLLFSLIEEEIFRILVLKVSLWEPPSDFYSHWGRGSKYDGLKMKILKPTQCKLVGYAPCQL